MNNSGGVVLRFGVITLLRLLLLGGVSSVKV